MIQLILVLGILLGSLSAFAGNHSKTLLNVRCLKPTSCTIYVIKNGVPIAFTAPTCTEAIAEYRKIMKIGLPGGEPEPLPILRVETSDLDRSGSL